MSSSADADKQTDGALGLPGLDQRLSCLGFSSRGGAANSSKATIRHPMCDFAGHTEDVLCDS